MRTMDISDYIPISEACSILGVNRQQATRLCREGKLPGAMKLGARWLVPRASAEDYVPGPKGFAAHPEKAGTRRR